MRDSDPAIHAIKLFLINGGFDRSRTQEGVHDGHWMLATIDLLCEACCRDSYEAGICSVLEKLERGEHHDGESLMNGESDWLPSYSAFVRAQAGLQQKE